jgi:Zn-dependent protease
VEPVGTGAPEAIAALLSIMFSLNVLLAAFNMLPLPPLDGWSAAGLLLPESGARRLVEWTFRAGMFQIVGLLVAWKLFGYIFPLVLGLSLRVLFAGL